MKRRRVKRMRRGQARNARARRESADGAPDEPPPHPRYVPACKRSACLRVLPTGGSSRREGPRQGEGPPACAPKGCALPAPLGWRGAERPARVCPFMGWTAFTGKRILVERPRADTSAVQPPARDFVHAERHVRSSRHVPILACLSSRSEGAQEGHKVALLGAPPEAPVNDLAAARAPRRLGMARTDFPASQRTTA